MIDKELTKWLREQESQWVNFKNYTVHKELCRDEEKTKQKGKLWFSPYWVVKLGMAEQDKYPYGCSRDYILEKLNESSIIKQFGSIEKFLEWKSLNRSEERRKARVDKIEEDIIHDVECDRYLKGQHSVTGGVK